MKCTFALALFILTLLLQERNLEQLIQRLDSDKAEQREEATRDLLKIGEKARPALQRALDTSNEETKQRVKELLQSIANKSAEGVLDRIDEDIRRAKTIRLKYKSEIIRSFTKIPPIHTNAEAQLLLEGPDRLAFAETRTDQKDSQAWNYRTISDGTKIVFHRPEEDAFVIEAPHGLAPFVASMLLSWGATDVGQLIASPGIIDDFHKIDRNKAIQKGKRTDVRAGERDGDAATVTFLMSGHKVKLWYNPETFTMLKRTSELAEPKSEQWRTTEIYEEFLLNPSIPAEKFKIPDAKK